MKDNKQTPKRRLLMVCIYHQDTHYVNHELSTYLQTFDNIYLANDTWIISTKLSNDVHYKAILSYLSSDDFCYLIDVSKTEMTGRMPLNFIKWFEDKQAEIENELNMDYARPMMFSPNEFPSIGSPLTKQIPSELDPKHTEKLRELFNGKLKLPKDLEIDSEYNNTNI